MDLRRKYDPQPSLLEVENRRYELNRKNGRELKLILSEELLKLFVMVQGEEDVFADVSGTAGFGAELLGQCRDLGRWLQ